VGVLASATSSCPGGTAGSEADDPSAATDVVLIGANI
jgi:hypothetical protein